ncbi:MAG TPA: DnaJ C-terminal domain-containing protein [Thermomicrobiales bacterium]|nr:DnaJ C-terminal domain-containing protein [Thermomicrobiales bacterium]
MDFKDYYQVLGVSRDADDKQIKKAYRSMARKFHPDVNKEASSEERFKAINEAYQVLSDPEKRAKYDRFGADWDRFQTAPGSAGSADFSEWFSQASGGAGGPNVRFEFNGAEASGFSDFFDLLFGSRGSQAQEPRRARRTPQRGADQEVSIELTLEQAFSGTNRTFELAVENPCPTCGGSGMNGRGPCPQCSGRGTVPSRSKIEVSIPRGVREGSRIRVAGKGTPGVDGGKPGDVYLRVKLKRHPSFELDGSNLRTTVEVPLYTAILGGETVIKTLSGSQIAVSIQPETQSGRVIRLRGQGWPEKIGSDERGDLLVKVQVAIPTDLTDRERELFNELRAIREPQKATSAA